MATPNQRKERCRICGGEIPEAKYRRVGGGCAACVGMTRKQFTNYRQVIHQLKTDRDGVRLP